MSQQSSFQGEEWLRVLSKGMVTLPKTWRDELGIKPKDLVKAKKVNDRIVIEPASRPTPFRIYSRKEFDQFLQDDQLSKTEMKTIDKKLANLK